MAASTASARGRIFISYRRQDSRHLVAGLYDRLAARFGPNQVLMDVDPIAGGVDYPEVIDQAVSTCKVLLAAIGPRWLNASDKDTQWWLDRSHDRVRLEIAAALEHGIRVIPILLEGAVMPGRQDLPENLATLTRRKTFSLRYESFDADADRLLITIERILSPRAHADELRAYRASPPDRGGVLPDAPSEPIREPLQPKRPAPEDEASFTAGYPGMVTPQIWYSLAFYVHLGRLQAEVDRHIAEQSRWLGLRPAVSGAAAHLPLSKGTQLQVYPKVQGVIFNPPAQEVRWLEDLQEVVFRMQATSDAAGPAVLGAVEVYVGPLMVGQVPLSIRVRGADELQEHAEATVTATAHLFDSVFVSYARKDYQVVEAVAEAYRALGIDVLVDKMWLRSGEDWQKALLRLIEDADLFQLFWSEAGSRSRYVAQEWRHALSLQDRKGERFIRPLYWNTPWPPPPVQLEHLHFAYLDLEALSSVAGRSESYAR